MANLEVLVGDVVIEQCHGAVGSVPGREKEVDELSARLTRTEDDRARNVTKGPPELAEKAPRTAGTGHDDEGDRGPADQRARGNAVGSDDPCDEHDARSGERGNG